MNENDNSYSKLYSGENNAEAQSTAKTVTVISDDGGLDPDSYYMYCKGRKTAHIIGVIYTIISVFSLLSLDWDTTQGGAYLAGQLLGALLPASLGILFFKGKNAARILLGIVFCIGILTTLAIIIPTIRAMGYFSGFMIPSFLPIVFWAAGIWFTLFDKSVKIYCKYAKYNPYQKKTD